VSCELNHIHRDTPECAGLSTRPTSWSIIHRVPMWYRSHATRRVAPWLLGYCVIVLPYKKIKKQVWA